MTPPSPGIAPQRTSRVLAPPGGVSQVFLG